MNEWLFWVVLFSEWKIVMNQSKRLLKQESDSFNSVDVFYHTHLFSPNTQISHGPIYESACSNLIQLYSYLLLIKTQVLSFAIFKHVSHSVSCFLKWPPLSCSPPGF